MVADPPGCSWRASVRAGFSLPPWLRCSVPGALSALGALSRPGARVWPGALPLAGGRRRWTSRPYRCSGSSPRCFEHRTAGAAGLGCSRRNPTALRPATAPRNRRHRDSAAGAGRGSGAVAGSPCRRPRERPWPRSPAGASGRRLPFRPRRSLRLRCAARICPCPGKTYRQSGSRRTRRSEPPLRCRSWWRPEPRCWSGTSCRPGASFRRPCGAGWSLSHRRRVLPASMPRRSSMRFRSIPPSQAGSSASSRPSPMSR